MGMLEVVLCRPVFLTVTVVCSSFNHQMRCPPRENRKTAVKDSSNVTSKFKSFAQNLQSSLVQSGLVQCGSMRTCSQSWHSWCATNLPGRTCFSGPPSNAPRLVGCGSMRTCSQLWHSWCATNLPGRTCFSCRHQSSKFVWVWRHAHLITLATCVTGHGFTGPHVFFVAGLD